MMRDHARPGRELLHPLPFADVEITEGFWKPRIATNRREGLNHGYRQLEVAGNFHDLRLAAGLEEGSFVGKVFMDSDVYKWLEAAAYELFKGDDAELRGRCDEAIGLIESAQRPDGYLNSYVQATAPGQRWKDLSHGHELYCAGHLFEAAVVFNRLLNDGRLLAVAVRFADLILERFGGEEERGTPGHPEVELALVELYRETGNARYLDLARAFIDRRGNGTLDPGPDTGHNGPSDLQDHLPVRDALSPEGHAVRQLYLNAGAMDLYLETGDRSLLEAMLRQWESMTREKLYVTGGLGSRHNHEAFGEPFELPNSRAYCETCAAIGSIMWSWRLLLATRESRFADLIELTLYNSFLSGVSLDSTRYFYCNPLLSLGRDPLASRKRIERMAWPWTPCCPPNVMRTFAQLTRYLATSRDDGLQIHQYIDARLSTELGAAGRVQLSMSTGLPWKGETTIEIESDSAAEWTLAARIPGWATDATAELNGQALNNPRVEKGYLSLDRRWKRGDRLTLHFPVGPYFVEADPIVDSTFASLAVKLGPVVYCLEQVDQAEGVDVLRVQLDERVDPVGRWEEGLLGGVTAIEVGGSMPQSLSRSTGLYRRRPRGPRRSAAPSSTVRLNAVPYYAWANRGPNAMRVWIPLSRAADLPEVPAESLPRAAP